MLKALIIDDETLARQRIRRLLEPYASEISIAGECRNGGEAITAIRHESPDLLFLDIQMKDMSGFDVLEALDQSPLPMVIFVTAFDRYAIQAFDVFAFDYLLKPFSEERFHRSVHKALETLKRDGYQNPPLQALLQHFHPGDSAPDRRQISIRMSGRICFLESEDIRYIEASGYYIELFTSNRKYLVRESLASIMERLDPTVFLRIHRSTVINRDFLQEITRTPSGDLEVVMRDEKRFRVSRSYRQDLLESLGI